MTRDDLSGRWRNALVFGGGALLAISSGAFAMQAGGLPPGLWLRNPIAWLVAGLLALFIAQRGWLSGWTAPAALVVIALSFIGAGQEGVHRWVELGPVQLNAAGLVLPIAIAGSDRDRGWFTAGCFVVIGALLAWQPDISQLVAFALAAVVLAAARFGLRGALATVVLFAALVWACLVRPDPLLPVDHVEGIFTMAASQSPVLAIAMAAGLAIAALSPLLLWNARALRWKAAALAVYFSATSLAWLMGAYPVPLAGYGISFVLGWWFGAAALTANPSKTAQNQTIS